jgi:acyl-CoA reductase-like NAD-dependent aldehyde dehydrogenase
MQVLPESPDAALGALDGGVAKVFLTGSATTGTAVQAELAPRLIPSTMELSGCDAVFVRADADLDLTVRALTFGLRLNNGETCIAPRRIFVNRSIATEFEGRLANALAAEATPAAPLALKPALQRVLNDALAQGAHLLSGRLLATGDCVPPLIVAGASTSMRLLHEDVFAPIMSLVTVTDDFEALEMARHCPYALAATIFTRDEQAANKLARQIHAGLVIVNDMIVPSADPRIPFGGRGHSGFGVTRGAEGLLEMTVPKVITLRRTRFLPHLDAPAATDAELFQQFLVAAHGRGWSKRLEALNNVCRLMIRRPRSIQPPVSPSDGKQVATGRVIGFSNQPNSQPR